jgi:hypothetical protein
MFEFNFCFSSPILLDLIQSVAALIAIPGAIAAFWKLFKKNDELQNAIAEIKRLAVASEGMAATETEKRDILVEHLDLLRSIVLKTHAINIDNEKLAELEERKHLLSLRPRLICTALKTSGSAITPWIENHGESAFLIGAEDITSPPVIHILATPNNRPEIIHKGFFQLHCKRRDGLNFNAPMRDLAIRISYADKEGNVYQQLLEGQVDKPLTMTEPKLIHRKKYDIPES